MKTEVKTKSPQLISLKYDEVYREVFAHENVRKQKHWVKRQFFYLAGMYEEDLRIGRNYGKLKRCISIGILDFRLLEGESNHCILYNYPLQKHIKYDTISITKILLSSRKFCLPADHVGIIDIYSSDSQSIPA